MPEFLEVLETIRQDQASVQNLFAAGAETRTPTRRGAARGQYLTNLAEAAKFIQEVKSGKRGAWQLQEAMSTSDFPILFGDILDRMMLGHYQTYPESWQGYAKPVTVNDFRTQEIMRPVFGASQVLDPVAQLEEYPEATLDEQTRIQWKVGKFGRVLGLSWETFINDVWNQFTDLPERLATAARRTEARQISDLYVGVNGPSATLYNNTNKNVVNATNGASANNPPLSIAAMQDAFLVLSKQVDEEGNPIFIDLVTLTVPPALEIPALNMLNAIELRLTVPPGSAGDFATSSATGHQEVVVANWMKNRVRLVIDPYIPFLATTANANTSWFLFANPNVGRPALEIGFLRGHETPEIWIKSPNARRIGGGEVNPTDGDFDNDGVFYRVRHVVGSTIVDPKMTVASNGSGS